MNLLARCRRRPRASPEGACALLHLIRLSSVKPLTKPSRNPPRRVTELSRNIRSLVMDAVNIVNVVSAGLATASIVLARCDNGAMEGFSRGLIATILPARLP